MWKTSLIILIALFIVAIPVVAEENGSYVVVEYPDYGLPNAVYRLDQQGQDVYLNDTIDISGQGWGSGVAWYGKYGEYDYPVYIRQFSGYKKDVQNFYIDPAIFGSRAGMWYQYYGNETEPSGNLEAFNVVAMYLNKTTTYPNGTIIATSEGMSNATARKAEAKEVILPPYHVADFVVAQGDGLDSGFDRIWIFGRLDGLFDVSGVLSKKQVWDLSQGSYKLVSHSPGKNTVYEVGYDRGLLTSPWRGVEQVDISALTPTLAMDKFNHIVAKTDDVVRTYNLEVQEASISVMSINEVDVGNRIPIAYEPGMTLLDVRGYTNAANGTVLSFIIDPETNLYKVQTTAAIESAPGDLRYYRIYIPINKNQMPNRMHTLKGWTAIGGEVYADFPVSELPADSFIPNATVKYIGDRNPWVPTPTPEIRVVEKIVEKPVIKTVTVEVTPSNEQIRTEQENVIFDILVKVVVGIVALFVLYIIGRFIYRARMRKQWVQK